MKWDLLFEIGTEEIPSTYIPDALLNLKDITQKGLLSHRLSYDEIKTFATPRRLAVMVLGLVERQPQRELEIQGPPKKVAFDAKGNPTKAFVSFLQRFNLREADVEIKDTPKGEYLFAKKVEEGIETREILKELLPEIVLEIPWPKSMRWGEVNIQFVRPIHWFLALYGHEVIDFELAGIRSSAFSHGHRFMAQGKILIQSPSHYVARLKEAWVMVDPQERRSVIETELVSLAKKVGGEPHWDEDLLDAVTNLVEWPFPLLGRFEQSFLEMPEEVLTTVMKKHQRYFPIKDIKGRLLPYFVTVNNTRVKDPDVAIKGNERVLRARFSDAKFFFEEDQRQPLLSRLEALKEVIFHASLGTSYQKVQRFKETATYLASICCPGALDDLSLACDLSKCDLTTHMVFEFPELQGVMGKKYAQLEGYKESICRAIEEHYWPLKAGDRVSDLPLANIIAIADRIDSIVGFFAIGQEPSGNTDPFALRRHALAIIRITEEMDWKFSLTDLIQHHIQILQRELSDISPDTFHRVYGFFKDRLRFKLIRDGFDPELVDGVLEGNMEPFVEVRKRLLALKKAMDDNIHLQDIAAAYKRIVNILKSAQKEPYNPALLTLPPEKALFKAYMDAKEELSKLYKEQKYLEALGVLAQLRPYVDDLFDGVKVLSDDPEERKARIGLLEDVKGLYLGFADFLRLGID